MRRRSGRYTPPKHAGFRDFFDDDLILVIDGDNPPPELLGLVEAMRAACPVCRGDAPIHHLSHVEDLAQNEEEAPLAGGAPSGPIPVTEGGSRDRLHRTQHP